LKIDQRHVDKNNMLHAGQFGCHVHHSTTLQYMRLTDHVTLISNNCVFTAAVFLDIEKASDALWYPGFLYMLYQLQFSVSILILIKSFLFDRKFRVSVEDEMFAPREIQAGVPQGSVLSLLCTPGSKAAGREADHSPPSIAEVKE